MWLQIGSKVVRKAMNYQIILTSKLILGDRGCHQNLSHHAQPETSRGVDLIIAAKIFVWRSGSGSLRAFLAAHLIRKCRVLLRAQLHSSKQWMRKRRHRKVGLIFGDLFEESHVASNSAPHANGCFCFMVDWKFLRCIEDSFRTCFGL